MPGKSYSESRQEAEIKLETEGKEATIATFLKVGYFFKNDELYIHDHITGNITLMPKGFHFLTVVKTGLNDYKLAFCNKLGNLFFEHKKYNKTYANLLEECKLIDLKYIKGSVKIDLSKYYLHEHAPPFAVKKGDAQGQSFENHIADVYEIERNEKVGDLIDEFGFFEQNTFHYINHNKEHTRGLYPQNFKYEGGFQLGSESIHPVVLDDSYTSVFNYFRDWMGL
ncbi:MAG: hypothetical protein PG981_000201 [Wolbachia endosymbiont of Ctenocephalides orientis wCori]|nr:MAG: hypothetical protein PG981_000201 [Wolbachia endosymbiont of Ctenocephalides orientis wCori]